MRKILKSRSLKGLRLFADESLDDLLHGRLKLIQKKAGYRYSVDSLLIADFALPEIKPSHKILDLGSGSGVISLILAQKSKAKKIIGIEIQKALSDMAQRSVELNRMQGRVKIINKDVRRPGVFKPGSFDLIVSNPPFRKIGAGVLSPSREKAVARHELELTMAEALKICRRLLKPKGSVALIYPFERLGELIAQLEKHKLNPARLKLVFHKKGDPIPILFCILLKKAKSPLALEPPYFVESEKGRFFVGRD